MTQLIIYHSDQFNCSVFFISTKQNLGIDNVKDHSETPETKENTSLQMNIYALFLRLGFNNQENLTFKDQITLKKIESYLDLKVRKTNNLVLLFIYDDYCNKLSWIEVSSGI